MTVLTPSLDIKLGTPFSPENPEMIIRLGDRGLKLCCCAGEQGSDGPIPCIERIIEGEETHIQAIHSKELFDKLWDFFNELNY